MFRRKKKGKDKGNVALFVDGPNIIRKEFSVNLGDLKKTAEKYGRLMVAKVFLNQYASDKLIEAIANQGMEPSIVLAGERESDVDVAVAVAAVEAAYNDDVDTIIIASRDADFLPVIQTVKKRGKVAVVIGMNPGFSKALQHAADHVEFLESE